ncbi:MAG: ABC transporter permease [Gammaproteobacteria bacterium]|jgi:phospholipid/cholesterol/gamma-HCH transport system permease protein|nr:ABC transporter permease [Gammaproteobacteria bacterium]MBT5222540.1 ABC transporter permease [Gammaproteobacteria bacterium]MBT5825314.1 ABC transporter permease [Gammaproteobacteria bacterium]MBT6420931.1 ABC transporter permease [Gammaproteobacteria bacterium]MBT6576741.1 ABC transporter permease [Gammaproteobacteria bacterium]
MNFFGWIGQRFIESLLYIIDFTYFFTHSLSVWQVQRNVFNKAVYSSLLGQLIFTGVDAIAMISFLAVMAGIGITSQLIYIMHAITGASDLTAILARIVVSELGPVITGVILVGRSCSAIAVDLGNTKVRGEIEPLEYMGIDVDDYFVVPRIVCMIISQVTLALYFSIITILCGVFFSAYIYNFSAQESLTQLLNTMDIDIVIVFMLKNLFFGLIIGAMACFHGLLVENSPTQVPQQMQRAVVRGLVFLFLADGYFSLFTL